MTAAAIELAMADILDSMIVIGVRSVAEFSGAFRRIVAEGIEGVLVLRNSLFTRNSRIAGLAGKAALPTMFGHPSQGRKKGVLMTERLPPAQVPRPHAKNRPFAPNPSRGLEDQLERVPRPANHRHRKPSTKRQADYLPVGAADFIRSNTWPTLKVAEACRCGNSWKDFRNFPTNTCIGW